MLDWLAWAAGVGVGVWHGDACGARDGGFASVVSVGLMGYLVERLVVFVEGRVLTWRRLQSH